LPSPPPSNIPRVPTPIISFESIAQQLAAGWNVPAWIKYYWELASGWFNDAIATLVSWAFYIVQSIGMWLVNVLIKAEDKTEPAFQQLAATAIKDVFGVDVAIGDMRRGNQAGRQRSAATVGSAVMQGLFGTSLAGGSGGPISPNKEGAEKYLSTVVNLAIEDWLEGWIFEMITVGQVEKFGELGDNLVSALGFSGMSRRVLRPASRMLVEDPFQRHLNKIYRPARLSVAEACRQYARGRATKDQLVEQLAQEGYSVDKIDALINAQAKFLGEGELDCLVSHGLWTEAQAVQHLRDQGYPETVAKAILQCVELRKVDALRRQLADVAEAAYVKRTIDSDQFRKILDTTLLPQRERDMIRTIAGTKRELAVKDLTTSEVEQCVKRGILTINDFRTHLQRAGYEADDIRTLELLLLTEINDEESARRKRDALAKQRAAEKALKEEAARIRREQIELESEVQEVSLAQLAQLVRRGLRSVENYRQALAIAKYSRADQEALAELLAGEISDRLAQEERREELRRLAAVKRVSLEDFERAVRRGLADFEDYRKFLQDQGFEDESSDLLISLLAGDITEAEEARKRREEAAAKLLVREISLDDVERGVRRGFVTVDQYRAFLAKEGFEGDRVSLLVQLVEDEIADDDAARKKREEAAAAAKRKKIPLADLELAVLGGLATMTQYRSALVGLGFEPAAVDLLERLLTLQLDTAAAAARKRAEAAAKLAIAEISLADVERAVKLGVTTVETYKGVLRREGFSAVDEGLLVGSLLAELAATQAARKARADAEARAKRKGVSLSDMERAEGGSARSGSTTCC
jgi:hypothetical protein